MSYPIAGIDEALRPGTYLMCATVVSTADRHHVRQTMRAFLLPGQRRLHAYRERDGRKRTILKALLELPGIDCHLVVGKSRDERHRGECLGVLADQLMGSGIREIIIERIDDGTAGRDAQIMAELARRHRRQFEWRHEAPDREPLLWISDLVLWAYGAGGDMRRAAERIISTVHTLDE